MEKSFFGKLINILWGLLFLLLFIFVSSQIFFKDQADEFFLYIRGLVIDDLQNNNLISKDKIAVVFPGSDVKFLPFEHDFYGRQILSNVFDPLVRLDKNLRPIPGLAVSYGLIDENVWNFVLKKNVKFHDGTFFDFEDVSKSFEIAKESAIFFDLFDLIEEIEKVSDFEFNIRTKHFDPLFLQRLSMLYIVSNEYSEGKELIGTGAFVFDKILDKEVYLYPNLNYWCAVPKIKEYRIVFEDDAIKRMDLLLEGRVDLLAFVPHSGLPLVRQYGFKTISLPSLEVQFLLFNFKSPIFLDKNFRKVFASIVNRQEIIELIGANLLSSNQFISSGVFGFNTNIIFESLSEDEIAEIISNTDLDLNINFVFPNDLEFLAKTLKSQFSKYGINIVLDSSENVFEDLDRSDIIFMTYKTDLGDFSQFLRFVVKSDAKFNYFNFKNDFLDERIEKAMLNTDAISRLNELKDINRFLIEEEIIGVPLFEYEIYYAFSKDLDFIPRLDGLIYFDDIKIQ